MVEHTPILPEWFKLGSPLLWRIPEQTITYLNDQRLPNPEMNAVGYCACIHYIHCLELSIDENKKGHHAVAISLIRQCIEAITMIEVALLPEVSTRNKLLRAWLDSSKTLGDIRKNLEKDVWSRYGHGLWQESWSDFFGSLCRAIQPYTHYSVDLYSWQRTIVTNSITKGSDGKYLFLAEMGMNTYESNKATRITCLHYLLAWTLGRIFVSNVDAPVLSTSIIDFGHALARSDELCHGKIDWATQFWAYEFTKP